MGRALRVEEELRARHLAQPSQRPARADQQYPMAVQLRAVVRPHERVKTGRVDECQLPKVEHDRLRAVLLHGSQLLVQDWQGGHIELA